MSGRRNVLLVLVLVLFHATSAVAQSTSPWSGIVADEARPGTPWYSSGSSEMGNRSMSRDGRFVVFNSSLDNLVAGDTNNASDVFMRDRETGMLHRVSVGSDGAQGNNYSAFATISRNGRHIAFNTCATNFDPADTNNSCDLYIRDHDIGATVRASIGPNGEQATTTTQHHFSLSRDGRYFAFIASFSPDYKQGVWLRDRDNDGNGIFDEPGTGVTTQITPELGLLWQTGYDEVAISPDGRWIAFNALTWDGTGYPLGTRLYLYDRTDASTVRIDHPVAGAEDTGAYSGGVDFSEAGHLAYHSNADNLVAGDADGYDDIFIYDLATGVHSAIELTHENAPAIESEWAPAISDDGRYVAFFGAEGAYTYWRPLYNVYAVDRQTGMSYEISVHFDGTRDNNAGPPSISGDGSAIAFHADPFMVRGGWGNNGVFVATAVALSPAEMEVPAEGGWFTVDVTVPANVAWTFNTPWPDMLVSQLSGVGPATIDVEIFQNSHAEERDLYLMLGSEQVIFHQGVKPFIYFAYPHGAPPAGGTPIEIYGYGFAPGATVTIDGLPAGDVIVHDSSRITATTPAHAVGLVVLTVTNPGGESGETPFEYLDDTPPIVTAEISGTPGTNGWYTSDVAVTWHYQDPESTVFINGCVNPFVLNWDVASLRALCSVTSQGGMTFEEVEIKRDTVAPIAVLWPDQSQTFIQGEVVQIAQYCGDDTAGIASCTLNQPGPNVDTSTIGTHELSLTAVDNAGHSKTTSTAYTVKMATAINIPVVNAVYGDANVSLRATLLGSGAPVSGKPVSFYVDNVYAGTESTGANGEAVMAFPLAGRNAGSYAVRAEFYGDETAMPAMFGSELAIAKATAVLTWATPSFMIQGAPLGSAQLNATSSVAGAFSYDPGFWTVLPAGSHTLTATFTPQDTINYDTASKSVTVKVKAMPVITWGTPAAITYPRSLTGSELGATANVAGTFVYTPAFGTLLDAGQHTLSVTFTPSNTADFVSASATVTLEVNKGTVTFAWPFFDPITYGTPLTSTQLNATAMVVADSGTLTYDPPAGTVLPAGTHTLTAIFTPNQPGNYHPATTTRTLLVGKRYPAVYWQGDLAPIVYGTPLDERQLYASSPVPGTFTYNPPAGTIINAGLQVIRATFTPDDTTNYHTVTHQKDIAVDKAVSASAWSTPAPIVYGTALGAAQLNATASVPGTFSYTPAAGTVLAAGTHQLQVYFTPDDSANYYGGTRYVTIVVEKRTPVITWNDPAPIVYGAALTSTQLNATVNVGGGLLRFTPAYGTVLNAGAGQTLTVTYEPGSPNYDAATATVTIDVVKATPFTTWTPQTGTIYGTPLGAAQFNATANVPGDYAYEPGPGAVLPAGTHTLTATFTPQDAANYAVVTLNRQHTVLRATPVLSWQAPASITYGTPLSALQLNATSSTPGTFTYTSPAGSILSAGTHTIHAYFEADDQANYLVGQSINVQIDVTPVAPVLTWSAVAPITYGTALSSTQLNAAANVAGSFSYSSAAGTMLPAGSHSITATFTPQSGNYTADTITSEIVVTKAASSISWNNPAGITYGTALSASQLNATANVAGAFEYTPALGTVLSAGTHNLAVTFTPDDSANYNGASANVSIVVGKAASSIAWSNPAAITYGTALSASQLNATANVAGAFEYTPALGTVLNAGTRNITVTFTPADAANYNSATANVSIVVGQAALTVQANDATKVYGAALPAFAATGTGFVNGDSMSSLSGALTLATTATATSAPGVYTLTASGVSSANYSITFTSGTLTISRASTAMTFATSPNPSANNQVVQLRAVIDAVAPGAGTATGVVEFRENGTLLGTATLVNGVATLNKAFKKGTHPLSATYAGDANFTGGSGAVTHRTP